MITADDLFDDLKAGAGDLSAGAGDPLQLFLLLLLVGQLLRQF